METTILKVQGMTCSGCTASVRRVLTAIDGVQSADVSLGEGQATVQYDGARVTPAQLRAAVTEAGYEAV